MMRLFQTNDQTDREIIDQIFTGKTRHDHILKPSNVKMF